MRSEVCTIDIASGAVRVIRDHDGHLEAPNWHPEGFLLVNGGGLLFRVALADGAIAPVDTGPLTGLNNDHGISPDGTMLALSDKTETGKSCIYLMPRAGGAPQRVTPLVPSWWHGWSPDGARIAYVGARTAGGPILPYTCALDGSDEVCLATDFDHVDGTDYTPDGAWIWFNGERDGAVDLWRIRPDGSDLQRMTDDDAVNWFPHPSPDGRNVVYLAYPPGTTGHPGGLDVSLRLIGAEGGPTRHLCDLHGGQGTINVPSWAPDGRSLAFVRYRD